MLPKVTGEENKLTLHLVLKDFKAHAKIFVKSQKMKFSDGMLFDLKFVTFSTPRKRKYTRNVNGCNMS